MSGQLILGLTMMLIGFGSLYWQHRRLSMKKNNTTGSGRFERVCTLYRQLEDLRKKKADFISNQNERIKITQDAINKLVAEDPNQTEIELESKEVNEVFHN